MYIDLVYTILYVSSYNNYVYIYSVGETSNMLFTDSEIEALNRAIAGHTREFGDPPIQLVIHYPKYSPRTYSYRGVFNGFPVEIVQGIEEGVGRVFTYSPNACVYMVPYSNKTTNKTDTDLVCTHSWVHYTGLLETYKYCSKCDIKG